MQDVTARFASFREGMRHLWNTQVLPTMDTAGDQWAVQHEFDKACSILFGILVVAPLKVTRAENAGRMLIGERADHSEPLRWLRLMPRVAAGVPIMINRDPFSTSGYWDHPVDRVTPDDVDLRFIDWFDFDELSFRDFTNFQVRIVASRLPELVGRTALIACEDVRVMLDLTGVEPT
jgi:hypothetical protein